MFERYNQPAIRAGFYARYEASLLGSRVIEPEHLLLGLLREDKNVVERDRAGAADDIRRKIEERVPVPETVFTNVDLPLSDSCRQIQSLAHEESEKLNHRYIGTGHLLLAIFRQSSSLAAQVLAEAGFQLDKVRESVARSAPSDPQSHMESGVQVVEDRNRWLKEVGGTLHNVVADRSSASHYTDDGALVVETRQIFGSHRIAIREQFRRTRNRKGVEYSVEVTTPGTGPGQVQTHSFDFDVSPDS